MSRPLVKICGLRDAEGLDAALEAGADMVGFVFFARSPRRVSPECAAALGRRVDGRAKRVALVVDATDDELDAIVSHAAPDILQLHGRETPARAAALKRRYGLAIMRALAVGCGGDLATASAFESVADFLLFDAPAPGQADRPGGNGRVFDWSLLRTAPTRRPWLLAGGLQPSNVAQALIETGAGGVDVSSGVERAPGSKDPARIRAFVAAARAAGGPARAREAPGATR